MQIFYKDKKIAIANTRNSTVQTNCYFAETDNWISSKEVIEKFIFTDLYKNYLIINQSPLDLFEKIMKEYKVVKAAGGLVFNEKNELLMIYRRGIWDLPKGKLDLNEKIDEAAIREVMEETGLAEVAITSDFKASYHFFSQYKINYIKETTWYIMYADSSQALMPQAEEQIEIAKWCNKEEILQNLNNSYRNIIELLNAYYNEPSAIGAGNK
jgi:8-oxo-dGTP pyrophosphatase MutT (NUDIX family)